MPDTSPLTSITFYINEIKKIDPDGELVTIAPLKTQLKNSPLKKESCLSAPVPSFEEWNLPLQAEEYIKGRKYDFL